MAKTRTLNPHDMEARINSLEENGGGGGGTGNYEQLSHLPQIGGVTLKGNKSAHTLGLATEGAVGAKAAKSDIATEFSAETSYTAGNYVYYEGALYIFNVDHAAGAWDATDVAVANVTDEITSNKAAIDALDTAVSGKSTVTANPEGEATGSLTSLGINGTKYSIPGGGGGSSTLSGLSDVNLSSPSNGQALTYDSTSEKWVNSVGLPAYDGEYDVGEALIVAQTGPDTYGLAWRMINSTMVRYNNAQSGLLTGNVQEAIDGLSAIASREISLFAGQVNYNSYANDYEDFVSSVDNIFDNNTAPALIGIDVSYVTKTVSGDTAVEEVAAGHAEFDPQYLLNKGFSAGVNALQTVVTIPVSRVSYNGAATDAISGSQLRGYITFSTLGTSAPDTYAANLYSLKFEPDVKVMNNGQETAVSDISADSSLYVRVYEIRRGTKL